MNAQADAAASGTNEKMTIEQALSVLDGIIEEWSGKDPIIVEFIEAVRKGS